MVRTLVAYGVWAATHSLLATPRAKSLARSGLGATRRNAVYRIGYNAVAMLTLLGLVLYVRSLPDRRLYRISWPTRALTTSTRLALVLVAVRAAAEVGVGSFSGLSQLTEYLSDGNASLEPEAQGPSMGTAGLRTGGPFRYVRHPLNASATAIVLLTPEMTVVRLTVAVITLLYSIVGSKLEERRLLARYGLAYETYRNRVPFLIPSFGVVDRRAASIKG